GPRAQTTYTSPLGPTAGTEACWTTPSKPQVGLLGFVMKVMSGPTITGPSQVSPPLELRHTSIWPKPNCAKPHTSLKLFKDTYTFGRVRFLAVASASWS